MISLSSLSLHNLIYEMEPTQHSHRGDGEDLMRLHIVGPLEWPLLISYIVVVTEQWITERVVDNYI